MVMSALNIFFILLKVKTRSKFRSAFIKPLVCTAATSVAAFLFYELLSRIGAGIFGSGRMAVCVYLAGAIVVAAAVYVVLIIVTRAVTTEDMKFVPKGDKLAKVFRIR